MKLTKYDKVEANGGNTTIIGGNTTINEGNQGGGGTRAQGDRTIWGQYDEGDNDIDGSMTVHGDIHIKSITPPTYDPDDPDDDGETIEEEEGGGSLDVELDVTVGRHLFINYPSHPEHPDSAKKCVGEILGTIEKNLSDEVTRAKASEKANADAIAAEEARAQTAEAANASNIAANAAEIAKLFDLVCPVGTIVMYDGKKEIPTNWHICDGTAGTPDLSGKFIKGTTTKTDVGKTGGASSVTLSAAVLPRHSHTFDFVPDKWFVMSDKVTLEDFVVDKGGSSNYCLYTGSSGGKNYSTLGSISGTTSTEGTSDTDGEEISIEPPYYELIFIMRVS